MCVYAITGKFGCGKTTVVNLLKKKGARVFDCDKVIHNYYRDKKSKVYKKVSLTFRESLEGKKINCKKLAEIVFKNKDALKKLESLIYPYLFKDLQKWILLGKGARKKISLVEVPLLFEKKWDKLFKKIILVSANKKIIEERLRSKGFKSYEIKQRFNYFIADKYKINKVDFIIKNNGSFSHLYNEVNKLWAELKKNHKFCLK